MSQVGMMVLFRTMVSGVAVSAWVLGGTVAGQSILRDTGDRSAGPLTESTDVNNLGPPDVLRFGSGDGPLFLAPAEPLRVEISLAGMVDSQDDDFIIDATLTRMDDLKVVHHQTTIVRVNQAGTSAATTFEIPSLVQSGVYALLATVTDGDGRVWSRFQKRTPIQSKELAVVVISQSDPGVELDRAAASFPFLWETIDELHASGDRLRSLNRWVTKSRVDAIPGVTRIPGIRTNPLLTLDKEDHAGQRIAKLAFDQSISVHLEPPIDMLPMWDQAVEQVYRVTIRCPADRPIHLQVDKHSGTLKSSATTFQIFQPRPYLYDAVEVSSDLDNHSSPEWNTYSFVVRLIDNAIDLDLKNRSEHSPAAIESIVLEALPRSSLTGTQSKATDTESQRTLDGFSQPRQDRTVLLRIDDLAWYDTLTADMDLASHVDRFDATTREVFRRYVAAGRLRDYLQLLGATGVTLPRSQTSRLGTGSDAASEPIAITTARSSQLLSRVLTSAGFRVVSDHDWDEKQQSVSSIRSDSVTNRFARWESLTGSTEMLSDLRQAIDSDESPVLLLNAPLDLLPLVAELQTVISQYVRLPVSAGSRIPGSDPSDETVLVWWYPGELSSVVLVRNLAPWSSHVDLRFDHAVGITDGAILGEQGDAATLGDQTGDVQQSLNLSPGELRIVRLQGHHPPPRWWSSELIGGADALRFIKWQVTQVVERMGLLDSMSTDGTTASTEGLINGGFETTSEAGALGWMHAQLPDDAVVFDANEAIEGIRSVRLTNVPGSANQSWVVYDSVALPASKRLAVSLSARAKKSQSGEPARLRVAFEGTVNGKLVRQSATISLPPSGRWQPQQMVLQFDGIENVTERLRLIIDNLTPGSIWVDDIRLHTRFPMDSEKQELQSQAYLAVQGLQQGKLTAASRLLHNPWALYLLDQSEANRSIGDALSDSTLQSDVLSNTEYDGEHAAPSVAERIRNWIPQPLRY